MKKLVPWLMVWLRVILCPILLAGAYLGWPGTILGLIVLIALVDDIYDGILARRWGTDTVNLRRADSAADTVFYLGVLAALWLREAPLLYASWPLIAAVLTLEVTRHLFDRIKFHRAAAYHSYLAKSWGLVMGIAVICAFAFNGPRWLLWTSLIIGIAADLEGLTMSLILPKWQNDIKSIPAALRLRQQILAATSNTRTTL